MITRAVTPIRLIEANPGKLTALDAMMEVYLPLCQEYTTLFCTQQDSPDKYTNPVYATELSDRLHRVAMQQAAGIAKSWRTNRANAYQAYVEDVADYAEAKAKAEAEGRMSAFKRKEPTWNEWNVPVLRVPVIQANANVVVVEKSKDSTFDYWLRVSTLDKGTPLRVPVKLASYRSEEHTSELQSHRDLHSFPTRRSSDLQKAGCQLSNEKNRPGTNGMCPCCACQSYRPMPMWWWLRNQKIPPSTTGSACPP